MALSKLKKLKHAAQELPAQSESMSSWVERYTTYLRSECHLSENTVAAYRRDLDHMKEWLNGRSPTKIKIDDLTDFAAYLKNRGLAPTTITRHVVAVRMFFKFLQLEAAVESNPAELLLTPKMWHRVPRVLTIAQVDRFMNAPRRSDQHYLRDKALLELMYASGCRVSEISNLIMANVHLDEGYCLAEGKGRKQRIVPLGERAIEAIRIYLKEYRPKLIGAKEPSAIPWLILSRTGHRLRREAIWELIKRSALRADVDPDITPHTLRHSFATHLLAGGADLRLIQEMLGHANIQTTQIYTQVENSKLKKIHRKFHPRS